MTNKKKKFNLKNYTTTISVDKTIIEIEKILSNFGATAIFKTYDGGDHPTGLGFQVMVNDSPISFKLPIRADKVLQVFKNQGLEPRYLNIEQATKTGWRILKCWIDSQVAMMEVELVKLEEVLLPFMYDNKLQKTFFEVVQDNNFNLQLE